MLLKANRAILKPTSELGRPSSSPSSRSFVKERRNPVMATVRRANANLMSTFQRRLRQGLMLRTDYIRETLRRRSPLRAPVRKSPILRTTRV
uniref:Uncharacterized protein n=1 Tax=Rousettus aegyptiacus TaxID=9407 RepID=A0A7J8F0D6_ROUAE|nr:hypothetical protein HJG63_012292 [Rousettus aegyptiacus]